MHIPKHSIILPGCSQGAVTVFVTKKIVEDQAMLN